MKYLSIRDLSSAYGKKEILKNINLDLASGERIGIIGKNGSGKTTLIETILGVNNAKVSGYLKFENKIEKEMKSIFQDYQYDRDFNLGYLYKIYCEISGIKPRKDLDTLFSEYDLSGLRKRKFHKLSGGQKQKFKLLMCLELHPKLLILDEITTSLDYQWRQEVLKIVQNYLDENKECSLILVSHDFNELTKLTYKQYLVQDKLLSLVTDLNEHFE